MVSPDIHTRVSVSTHQLLEPAANEEGKSTVELLVHVIVRPTRAMIDNLGF